MMIWRFRRLLEAYGADPAHWPEEERAAAEALLRRSAAARVALAEARELDGLLRQDGVAATADSLAALVIARALAEPQDRSVVESPLSLRAGNRGRGTQIGIGRGMRFGLWPQLAGLAVAGLLGFLVGAADLGPNSPDESIDLSDFVDFNSDMEDPPS